MIVACALTALLPVALIALRPGIVGGGSIVADGPGEPFGLGYAVALGQGSVWIALVLGVALLGLVDDLIGRSGAPGSPRGWRGHLGALASGELSTGVMKLVGILSLAALTVPIGVEAAGAGAGGDLPGGDWPERLVAIALVAGLANLLNLFDTRPGRATKVFVVLAVIIVAVGGSFEPLHGYEWLIGPILVVGFHDLRGRVMLGDMGSNLLGALLGVWAVTSLGPIEQLLAMSAVVALTAYGEFRSLGVLLERLPLIKHLDSLGSGR